jgi:hypothetical protein
MYMQNQDAGRGHQRPPSGGMGSSSGAMPMEMAYGNYHMTPEMMQAMQMQQMGGMPVMMSGPMVMPPSMGMYPSSTPAGISSAGPSSSATMLSPDQTKDIIRAAGNIYYKTRICNKWKIGQCQYGDRCTYAHGEQELRFLSPELISQMEQKKLSQPPGFEGQQFKDGLWLSLPRNYKTRLCMNYTQTGTCLRGGNCTFAHGSNELRANTPPNGNGYPSMTAQPAGFDQEALVVPNGHENRHQEDQPSPPAEENGN